MYRKVVRVLMPEAELSPQLTTKSSCQVKATLLCPRRLKVKKNQIYAEIPPLPAEPGQFKVPVAVFAPSVCRLIDYQPHTCSFTLDLLYDRTFPVKPVGLDIDLSSILSKPMLIQPAFVKVVGPKDHLNKVAGVVVFISSSDLVDGSLTKKPIVLDKKGTRMDIKVVPPELQVNLTPFPKIRRKILVKARFSSYQRDGQELSFYQIDPPTVWVVGDPQSVLTLDFVETETIDLQATSGKRLKAKLEPLDGLSLKPEEVTIILHFRKEEKQ